MVYQRFKQERIYGEFILAIVPLKKSSGTFHKVKVHET